MENHKVRNSCIKASYWLSFLPTCYSFPAHGPGQATVEKVSLRIENVDLNQKCKKLTWIKNPSYHGDPCSRS
uniref:Uncharacterized protein n=1 Tax=Romanomermis culicivorax TaxID=13658 RepID=A0A915JBY7_ROMCU